MFRKILIPLDGSPLAEKALRHVMQLASPDSAELVLVNVIETYLYSFGTMEMASVNVLPYMRSSVESYMDEQCQQLEARGYTVHPYVVDGDAATGILDVATATDADLIVMTTHGRSGVDRWILGSVAERVMHNTTLPVWLVRNNTQTLTLSKIRRILVPLDGSTMAETALVQAQLLAQQSGAELLLLRVVPEPDDINRRMIFATESSAQQALATWRSHAEQYLTTVVEKLASAGINTRARVASGVPVQSVLDTVATDKVDCIVMATHARLGVDRLLHGSVAAQILHDCTCPMLLIRSTDASVPSVPSTEAEQAVAA